MTSPLSFTLTATSGRARAATLTLAHGPVPTPVYMPVGTQGSVKGLRVRDIEATGSRLILGNTFHLGLRPGPEILEQLGGLHRLSGWSGNLLTDSGGFQMVSLCALSEVTEHGVSFDSPHDGTHIDLPPEESMRIQSAIGADIIMALDDVIDVKDKSVERRLEACARTIRWIDRCKASANPRQALYGIVQGGLDPELRRANAAALVARDLPGYAIGGLSGGESKDEFWRTVRLTAELLPTDKPRYLMGVGYPLDLVVCVALGVDQFDCVYATRTARFGNALTSRGTIALRKREFATDFGPLDPDCDCSTCTRYPRAMLHRLAGSETMGAHLISYHNIYYLLHLMADARAAIIADTYAAFAVNFCRRVYGEHTPAWAVDALASVDIAVYPTRDDDDNNSVTVE